MRSLLSTGQEGSDTSLARNIDQLGSTARHEEASKPTESTSGLPDNDNMVENVAQLSQGNTSAQADFTGILDLDHGQGVCTVTGPLHVYYLPGNVERQKCMFLLDTGCTFNIISRQLFERLTPRIQSQLRPTTYHGITDSGSPLPLHGMITLSGRLRTVPFTAEFAVADIAQEAILGISFFTKNECGFSFKEAQFCLKGNMLKCVDKSGKSLVSDVQVLQAVTIPASTEHHVKCRVRDVCSTSLGLVERRADSPVLIAPTLHDLVSTQLITIRCLNLSASPVTLQAGSRLAQYVSLAPGQISEQLAHQTESAFPACPVEAEMEQVPAHLEELYMAAVRASPDGPEFSQRVQRLLCNYSDVFSKDSSDVGRTHLVQHSIPVAPGTRPIRHAPRRLGPEKEAEVEKQVQKLQDQGMISPSDSAWASPVVLVKKKDGSWRFCIDYRRLNNVTNQDAYPLPRIDESLDALAGSKYFSTLDLTSGYWQVPLDPDAQEKSAFITRGGLWKWNVLPFGLTSAPATFQRMMEQIFRGLHWKTLLLYLDDVIVIGNDFETHCRRLEEVLARLRSAGLKLKPSKCELFQTSVKYLGHIVSQEGVSTDPDKIQSVAA